MTADAMEDRTKSQMPVPQDALLSILDQLSLKAAGLLGAGSVSAKDRDTLERLISSARTMIDASPPPNPIRLPKAERREDVERMKRLWGLSQTGGIVVVVDECVKGSSRQRYETLRRHIGIVAAKHIPVWKTLPGASDLEIESELLTTDRLLVTADKEFHNRVIARGGLSFYVGADKLRLGQRFAPVGQSAQIDRVEQLNEAVQQS